MPAPVLDSFAQRLYDGVKPLAFDDANQGYALALYLGALGTMFQIVEDYAQDQLIGSVITPGWSQLVDIDRCPVEALPWLAQFVGVVTRAGLSEAQQRDRIRSTDGWSRGTPAAIIAAAQQYLTGAKTVILRERDPAASASDPAYGLTVITYESQTPVAEWPTTNLCPEPSFETGATGWSGSGTPTRVNDWAYDGSWSYLLDATPTNNDCSSYGPMAACAPGDTITVSAYLNALDVSNGNYCIIEWFNGASANGNTVPGTRSTSLGVKRVSTSGTAPASTTQFRIRIIDDNSGHGAVRMRYKVDAVQYEKHPQATPFVIGSRAAGSVNILNALLEQKPAGIVLNYQVLAGEDYQSLLTNHPLYSNVFADFATYQGVATATPGT